LIGEAQEMARKRTPVVEKTRNDCQKLNEENDDNVEKNENLPNVNVVYFVSNKNNSGRNKPDAQEVFPNLRDRHSVLPSTLILVVGLIVTGHVPN
jgi:hypothetical protein